MRSFVRVNIASLLARLPCAALAVPFFSRAKEGRGEYGVGASRWCVLLSIFFVFAGNGETALFAQSDPDPSALLRIADFDHGVRNHAGGFHNASERAPSAVSMTRVSNVYRGAGGKSLRITAKKKRGGFAAVWISFHDFRRKSTPYLDTREYPYLSFWVKGKQGGEKFRIKLADDVWAAREDGLVSGPITRFLPRGVTGDWQEVLIPLAAFPTLGRKAMAFVTFDFNEPGTYTIFVDDITFKKDPGIPTPMTPQKAAAGAKRKDYPRAMWDWNPLPHVLNASQREDFLAFCRREKVRRVWMQLPTRFVGSSGTDRSGHPLPGSDFRVEILHPEELRTFLAAAHGAGIQVEALDGAPEYGVKKFHHIPLGIVDAVIAFNGGGRPEERFDGVHFDNEPYLLIGWHFPELRKQILEEYLELNLSCQRRIRLQSNMVFGVDIPFWWQSLDAKTEEGIALVSLHGVEKAASYHCIDTLDSVGVMSYRNTAEGADGMLAYGLEILEYAEKARKAKVYLGVETITEPPIDVWFVAGGTRKESWEILKTRGKDILLQSRIQGFRAYVLDDGAHLHFGIGIPAHPSPAQSKAVTETMARIATLLGTSVEGRGKHRAKESLQAAMRKIDRDPEWTDPKVRNIPLPSGKKEYAGFQASFLFLPKITFGHKTIEEMRSEIRIAEEEFREYEQYAGIAIHHYETYRRKVDSAGHRQETQ
jgi:hypothetical protein